MDNRIDRAEMARGRRVGDLVFHDARGRTHALHDPRGRPTIVAFEPDGIPHAHDDETLRALLRGLGAILLRVGPRAIVRVTADDAPTALSFDEGSLGDRLAVDASDVRTILVLDGQRRVRARHDFPRDGDPLPIALRAVARAMRETSPAAPIGVGRREMLVTSLVAAFAALFAEGCTDEKKPVVAPAKPVVAPTSIGAGMEKANVTLHVNGKAQTLEVEARTSLLDALRNQLALTGTKRGCDMGQCGACTVLVDGRRVLSCLSLAIMHDQKNVTTIEGVGTASSLHPMQRAFVAHDGFQCGYCTPGQIVSAIGMLGEGHAHSDEEVREAMSGNICRCGAYTNIVAAIQAARKEA